MGKAASSNSLGVSSGGPEVKAPAKEGFGTWLIRNGIPDAEVELEFPPGGAVCRIKLPAESLELE